VPTHRLLLAADLVDLLQVCKPHELQDALRHFGIEISIDELERSMKLLAFFGHVGVELRGAEVFYVRRQKGDRSWVNYTALDGMPPFDRTRFKLDRRSILEGQKRHMSVLRRTE
jgi:hypothetical protein